MKTFEPTRRYEGKDEIYSNYQNKNTMLTTFFFSLNILLFFFYCLTCAMLKEKFTQL